MRRVFYWTLIAGVVGGFAQAGGAAASAPIGQVRSVTGEATVTRADGTVVTHDTRSGDTRVQRPDGRAALLAGRTPPPAGGSSFAFADGTRLRGTDVAGRPARLAPDGTVHYPDGTRATHDTRSGDTRFTAPDGTQRLINRRKSIDRTVRPPPGSARPPRPAAAASADPRYAGALLTLPPDALVTAPPVRGAAAPASAPRPIDPFATARR